jgi:hypothetical protein
VPDEETVQGRLADRDALLRQGVTKLEQGPVPMLGEPGHDLFPMRLCLMGIAISAEPARLHVTLPQLKVSPTTDARGTYAEPFGGFPMGRAAQNRSKHTNAQINRKGFRHIRRPPPADSLNQTATDLQSPSDSLREGTALTHQRFNLVLTPIILPEDFCGRNRSVA